MNRELKRQRATALGCAALLSTACATACATGPATWYKPGATQQEFDLTSFRCKDYVQQSAGMYGNDPLAGMLAFGQDLMNECMQAHGWHQGDRE